MADTTPNRAYPKPEPGNKLRDDVGRLRAALDGIDADVQTATAAADAAGLAASAAQNTANAALLQAQAANAALPGKADKATTLAGYGITDATPALTPITTTTNAAAINGRHHILITAGITLTAPATPADQFRFGVTNATDATVYIAWGAKTVKGMAPNPTTMAIPARATAIVQWSSTAQTWVQQ